MINSLLLAYYNLAFIYNFVKKKVTYEQPLNEHIRSLLRLEHLFANLNYHLKGPTMWDSRAVLIAMIEILELIARIDFRVELLKDLQCHTQSLERWRRIPDVDISVVNDLSVQTHELLELLEKVEPVTEDYFAHHQLLNSIKQRQSISGGTCGSDLPLFNYWLHKKPKQRQDELMTWLAPLSPIKEAVALNLYLIRNNAVRSQEMTSEGSFQLKLDASIDYQLVQVNLPIESLYFPEINGSKHRVSVRFFASTDVGSPATLIEQDNRFELCCCMI